MGVRASPSDCRILEAVARQKRRAFALVLLSVLTVLPVSGTVCLALCTSATASASAHESGHGGQHGSSPANCHESASPAEQPQLGAVFGHDCLAHGSAIQDRSEALTAGRADATFIAATRNLTPSPSVPGLASLRRSSGASPPVELTAPARPLVLRI
jgi:hypothetical protein